MHKLHHLLLGLVATCHVLKADLVVLVQHLDLSLTYVENVAAALAPPHARAHAPHLPAAHEDEEPD